MASPQPTVRGRSALWLRCLAGALATALASPSHGQCCPHASTAEVVVFHARGAWSAPSLPGHFDPANLAEALQHALTAAPPAVTGQGPGLWIGVAEAGQRGVYRAFLLRGGMVHRVLAETVRDLRVAKSGAVAVVTPEGGLSVLDASGQLVQISRRARTPAWNDEGTELLFVAERRRGPGDGTDPTTICHYRSSERRVVELAHGDSDFHPFRDPRTGDVLFASGRSGMAAFWRLRAGTNEPVQLCNFGLGIDADFVPMPRRTPVPDVRSGRVVYEIDYGEGVELWCLTVPAGDGPAIATRVARGADADVTEGRIRYTSRTGGASELSLTEVATSSTDFGLRKDPTAWEHPRSSIPGPTATGFFSPLKVEYPLIYNAYKCGLGWRNNPTHSGHDFDAPRFTQQYAAGDGVVTEWQDGWGAGSGRGNFVTIRHDWIDRSTVYWHLQAGTVWPAPTGAFVGVGMPIGRTGDSGGSNNIPHVHFGVFDEDWLGQNWNDPTGFYAFDKITSAPNRFAPSWRSPGSCNLLQLPVPDYVRLSGIDSLPPTFGNPRVVRVQDLGQDVMLHFEMDIADPSGVFDEASSPTLSNPNARGVYLVINPIEAGNPPGSRTARIPMSLRSGDRFRGTYRTDYPLRWRKERAVYPDVDLLSWCVVAEDDALRGISWRGIGNGGYCEWLSLTETLDGDADAVVSDLARIDLSATITTAPARIAPGVPFELTVLVRNLSGQPYQGDTRGTAALNPLRDLSSPYHIPLGSFPIPALAANASTEIRLGPFTAPAPLLFLPQNLIVSLDAPNDPDPANSADRRTVHVVPALPDFVIQGLSTDDTVGHGERLHVVGRIFNVGLVPTSGSARIGLGISLDRIPNNGNDLPLGLFDIPLGTLAPQQSVEFDVTSLPVPGVALLGPQYLIVCVDTDFRVLELDEFNNCADRPVQVVGPEVAITAVEPLSTGIGGTDAIPVRVTLHNSGRGTAAGNVHVTIRNGDVTNWGDVLFQVGPGQTVQVQTTVPTPPVFGLQPGQSATAPVVACHDFVDPVPANNCGNTTVQIAFPWWDLRLTVEGPQTMGRNQWHTWRVRVHNAGNVWSQGRCVRSGISLQSGEDWGMPHFILNQCGPGPIQTKPFGSIPPGGEVWLDFGMCISGGALVGWQYLKVGIDTFNGCHDIYPAGNYDDRGVYIQ